MIDNNALMTAIMASMALISVIGLVWYVLMVVANWRIFTKAGEAGWKSIIPFYNMYTMFKISWNPVMFWVLLAAMILAAILARIVAPVAVILYIVCIVISVMQLYKFAKAFGQGIGFTIGLILLNPIFMLILAFSGIQYVGKE